MSKLLPRLCGLLAGMALFGIMALTLVDVAGRKFFSASLPGALEVTELLMVAVIFAGLPLVSLHREHVVFDSLDRVLPAALRRVQRVVVDALCAAALAGVAGLMWVKAGQLGGWGDTTAQLELPLAPFVYAMSLLCALTAAVHAVHAVRPGAGGRPGAAG